MIESQLETALYRLGQPSANSPFLADIKTFATPYKKVAFIPTVYIPLVLIEVNLKDLSSVAIKSYEHNDRLCHEKSLYTLLMITTTIKTLQSFYTIYVNDEARN
jgi:hypothetical protein